MLKKITLVLLIGAIGNMSFAETAKEEISKNPTLFGCMYRAYPGPSHQLTPAPKGKKPFYISHYGRHGSRWLIGKDSYTYPTKILLSADSAGVLTSYGKGLLDKMIKTRDASTNRLGELTQLGAQQHREIGGRMYDRFPDVFADSANIEARSSVVIRCILSMLNELTEMKARNPQLRIWTDASENDMWYIAGGRENIFGKKWRENGKRDVEPQWYKEAMEKYKTWSSKITANDVKTKLFTDTAYMNSHYNMRKFLHRLQEVVACNQNLDIRDEIGSLYDVFTLDELYDCYRLENAYWYVNYGANPWTKGRMPYSQRFLLRDFITKADSCIVLPHPGATMRFGHDTMVCPLAGLLGLNGLDETPDSIDFDDIDEKWRLYDFVPMAANIQFIFYRSDVNDKDVLVKVLLNEDEARLTKDISTDMFPYYHWKDVRDYFVSKLDAFEATLD